MAARALIIAIENYLQVEGGGMAKTLPGTLQAGLNFRDWLLEKWNAEGAVEPQLIFCSEPVQSGGRGATSDDIRNALLELKENGQNSTEELYVFFSGHGFSFREKPGSRVDILVSSDFRKPALSTQCCLKLDEIIFWLRIHLGPGRHYYFVDSCRNPLTAKQIQPSSLLPIDPQASGEASTFLLQSTIEGATAAVGGPFPAMLLAGLRGRGKAKTWDTKVNDAMFVRYDSLRAYLKRMAAADQQITSRADGTDGESDAVLVVLRPIPLSNCKIEINAPPPVKGEIMYRRGRSKADEHRVLSSGSSVLQLEPDDYLVSVRLEGGAVSPRDPVPVDLYEDQTLVFSMVREEILSAPVDLETAAAAVAGDVDFFMPEHTALMLHNVLTGEEIFVDETGHTLLPAGRYLATFGNTVDPSMVRKEIEVAPGETIAVNLAEWRQSAPHVAIASQLPYYAVQPSGLDFSESLGGLITDPDLDLWLAIVGGGRVLGSTGDFSKLANFPLHQFLSEPAGASPIYVLAGFENVDTSFEVALSRDARVRWSATTQPYGMSGIRESYLSATPGSQLLSFRIGDQPGYTVATLAAPNRVMLVTVTLDEEGGLRVSQYLLPLGHLVHYLPQPVKDRLQQRRQLRDVQFIARANRAFRKRRDLMREVDAAELTDLLQAKWLDPIASTLAAYEALRRGRSADMQIVGNMKLFFSDVPDTMSLAKLAGEDVARPIGTPLFLDGLRAFPDYANWLPLPAGQLDFSGMWTAWLAAVDEASC